jgi:N6-adenosine-specific RNA methylase IME4
VRKFVGSPRREHSRKLDEAYELIEALIDGPYLELFSRTAIGTAADDLGE